MIFTHHFFQLKCCRTRDVGYLRPQTGYCPATPPLTGLFVLYIYIVHNCTFCTCKITTVLVLNTHINMCKMCNKVDIHKNLDCTSPTSHFHFITHNQNSPLKTSGHVVVITDKWNLSFQRHQKHISRITTS